MRMPKLAHLVRYLATVGLMAATTVAFVLAGPALSPPLVALLYLLPVGFCTAVWGLGPGVTSALSAFLTFNYFFIEPYHTFAVHHPSDVVMLLVFLIVAVVISQLLGSAQRGLAAAQAREREATQLYELSLALAGRHDQRAIGGVLVGHSRTAFRAHHIRLALTVGEPFTLDDPSGSAAPALPPTLAAPIQTARGEVGQVQLWREGGSPTTAEKRLLHTFASQVALALERAGLAEAEARARVLEESDRLKTAILSSVSHELRTPLSTIKAAVTSLRSGEVGWDSGARGDLLAAIEEESDHLNLLVGNLLDMSRLESGALRPQRGWNLLSEIVGGVLQRLRRLSEGYQIEVDLPEDLPMAPVDYVQMEQVFANLLSNSLKYAPSGTAIRIKARVQPESTLLVQVTNQGPPVPEEHLERIFDKFYRITAAERISGIGLGLSICKGIVEAHGGRIWAENLDGGFAFKFTLPLKWDGVQPPPLEIEAA
jgi:two-component system sensor histidine kinase KdpD